MNSEFQLHPEAASTFATQVDAFYFFMLALSAVWVVLMVAVTFHFCLKYRRKSRTHRPDEIHGNNMLEVGWTIIPFILSMGIFFWGAHIFVKFSQVPEDAMEILVTGKQWMWRIQQPDGTREINTLHVPVGQPVKLTMTSEDVLHSFFIPAFRVKMDVVPGRYTQEWFEATKPGKYHLFCAEYCGTEHSMMGGWVHAMKPADYEAWLAESSGGVSMAKLTPADAGEKLFEKLGCVTCHAAESGALGPNLVGVFGREEELADGQVVMVDEDYVRESILNPLAKVVKGYQPVMPTFEGQVNEAQIMQLLAYIKSIGGSSPAGTGDAE